MLKVDPREPERQTCPLCHDRLGGGPQTCASCQTAYHGDCMAELGGCSTLGCRLLGKLPQHLERWQCRACHGALDSDLARRRCRCGAFLHNDCVWAHGEVCVQARELWPAPRSTARRLPLLDRWLGFGATTSVVLLALGASGWVAFILSLASKDQGPRVVAAWRLLAGLLLLGLTIGSQRAGKFPWGARMLHRGRDLGTPVFYAVLLLPFGLALVCLVLGLAGLFGFDLYPA